MKITRPMLEPSWLLPFIQSMNKFCHSGTCIMLPALLLSRCTSSSLVWIGRASQCSLCPALALERALLHRAANGIMSNADHVPLLKSSAAAFLFISLTVRAKIWPLTLWALPLTHAASSMHPKCLSSGMTPLPAEVPHVCPCLTP